MAESISVRSQTSTGTIDDLAAGAAGGPIFLSGTSTLVAIVSFGTSSTCCGTTGAYQIDQADDLQFLATFR
jgi:secreted trypsin-like serine protease